MSGQLRHIEEVLSCYKKGIRVGTAVTRGILDRLSSPDLSLKIIHIAGTNGKGSVAEYMTQILVAAGKKVGTFQSPAVYAYEEQFRINGKPIDLKKLDGYFEKALEAAKDLDATGFELETAGALYAFKEEGCEYAVLECGMGGMNDATNAVINKELALITSISLEHTAFLGGTLEEICEQKSGIIRGCSAVVSALQPREIKNYFAQKSVIFAGQPQNVRENLFGAQSFVYGGKEYSVSMLGSCQPYNAALAIEAAKRLEIDENAIYSGVKAAKLAGRLEVIYSGTHYILDGAHNPAAIKPLCDLLKNFEKHRVTIIYGCLSDKDMDGVLRQLSEVAVAVIPVQCPPPRGRSLDEVTAACRKYFDCVVKARDLREAIIMTETEIVVVCGSFTILSEAKKWIEKEL